METYEIRTLWTRRSLRAVRARERSLRGRDWYGLGGPRLRELEAWLDARCDRVMRAILLEEIAECAS